MFTMNRSLRFIQVGHFPRYMFNPDGSGYERFQKHVALRRHRDYKVLPTPTNGH